MRPFWRGFLEFPCVAVPVTLSPVTAAGSTLRAHHLYAVARSRLQPPRFCPRCNGDVAEGEIVNGYRYAKQRYFLIDDEEPDRVEVPGQRAVTILRFADRSELAALQFDDRAFRISPEGPGAAKGQTLLNGTMRERGRVAFGTVDLDGQEHRVALVPWERDLLLHILVPTARMSRRAVDLPERLPGEPDPTPSRVGYHASLRGLMEAEAGGQRGMRPQAAAAGRAKVPAEVSPWSETDLLGAFEAVAEEVSAAGPAASGQAFRAGRRWALAGGGCLLLAGLAGAAILDRPFIEERLGRWTSLPALLAASRTRPAGAPAAVGTGDVGPPRKAGAPSVVATSAPAPPGPLPGVPGVPPGEEAPAPAAPVAQRQAAEAPVPRAEKDHGSAGETVPSTRGPTAPNPQGLREPGASGRPERFADGEQRARSSVARAEPPRPASLRPVEIGDAGGGGNGYRQAAAASSATSAVAPSPWFLWTRRDGRAGGRPGGQLLVAEWRPTERFESEAECQRRSLQSFQPAQGGVWYREAGQEQIRAGCRPGAAGRPGT